MGLLRSQQYQGAGGYGGITSLNQDQRQGKYFPHKNVYVYIKHPNKFIKCFICKQEWSDNSTIPAKCKKDDWMSAEEILAPERSEGKGKNT